MLVIRVYNLCKFYTDWMSVPTVPFRFKTAVLFLQKSEFLTWRFFFSPDSITKSKSWLKRVEKCENVCALNRERRLKIKFQINHHHTPPHKRQVIWHRSPPPPPPPLRTRRVHAINFTGRRKTTEHTHIYIHTRK